MSVKYYKENKEKALAYQAEYNERNKDKIKNYNVTRYVKNKDKLKNKYVAHLKPQHLMKKYKLTLEEYNLMKLQQNNCCAICKVNESEFSRSLSVDHCHKTSKVRGLLCYSCNRALGYFFDDVNRLKTAIEYLQNKI